MSKRSKGRKRPTYRHGRRPGRRGQHTNSYEELAPRAEHVCPPPFDGATRRYRLRPLERCPCCGWVAPLRSVETCGASPPPPTKEETWLPGTSPAPRWPRPGEKVADGHGLANALPQLCRGSPCPLYDGHGVKEARPLVRIWPGFGQNETTPRRFQAMSGG